MSAKNPLQSNSAGVLDTFQISSYICNATSLDDVRASLAALHTRESAITSSLKALLVSQAALSCELGGLDFLRTKLGSQVVRFYNSNTLTSSADKAARLSNGVNKLELEKQNVQQTLHVVEQVVELKASIYGVVGSMGAPQDWETAAGYMGRGSKVPSIHIRSGFAENMVPSIEVPDTPWVTLDSTRKGLSHLFLQEFNKAAKEGNSSQVTRVFKLFPLIGCRDVGT
jgi:hypothetical protein